MNYFNCSLCKTEFESYFDDIFQTNGCGCQVQHPSYMDGYKVKYDYDKLIIVGEYGSKYDMSKFSINSHLNLFKDEDMICDDCIDELIVTDQIIKIK
jgi:hypothetical protein